MTMGGKKENNFRFSKMLLLKKISMMSSAGLFFSFVCVYVKDSSGIYKDFCMVVFWSQSQSRL